MVMMCRSPLIPALYVDRYQSIETALQAKPRFPAMPQPCDGHDVPLATHSRTVRGSVSEY
ncbi:MAG: hypothetical protein OJF51_005160 [Nitrospira sp.]|nr:MAG: hypothetical protein OJF51_005160 [Nitrospira sp.]